VKCYFISASVPRTAAFELHMVVRYLLRPNSVSTYPLLRHCSTVSSKYCFTPVTETCLYLKCYIS